MARPWISLLLLSLVLVAIDAEDAPSENEDCPAKTVCLLFARGPCNGIKRGNKKPASGYNWERGSHCNDGFKRFFASLWIEPLTLRKWRITTRIWQDEAYNKAKNDILVTDFDFGNAKIGWIENKTEKFLKFSWKKGDDDWMDSLHAVQYINKWADRRNVEDHEWFYPAFRSDIESEEKLISIFGKVDEIKLGKTEGAVMKNTERFNELLQMFTICDISELNSAELDNENGTIIMEPQGTVPIVACSSKLWYRNPGEEWNPMDAMWCNNRGNWEGRYTPMIKKEKTEEDVEEESTDQPEPETETQRAARASDPDQDDWPDDFEWGETTTFNLTNMDVSCSAEPPAAAPMTGSMTKIAIGVGIGIFLLVVIGLILGAVFFVLRRKRAAAGPNDTFRGSDSKAQTPIGGSMSKKSGSVVEIGGMSPAGTPNTPK